jgi:hypothetical protein
MTIEIKTTLINIKIIDCTNYSDSIKNVITEAIRLHNEVKSES